MLPITLGEKASLVALGLLDTGAAVNVMPHPMGVQLGFEWESQTTPVQLSGNLAGVEARVLVTSATVAGFASVRLAFAWAKVDAVPLILGQVNFFLEFDACFYRSKGVFNIRPKSA
jgi:hypothetical protein